MNIITFQKYWKILKRNYNNKSHTQEDMKIYYSIFKDLKDDEFKEVIKQVLKKQKYFPNIAEINQYVETKLKEYPEWLDKKIENEELTKEEMKEMKELLKEFK